MYRSPAILATTLLAACGGPVSIGECQQRLDEPADHVLITDRWMPGVTDDAGTLSTALELSEWWAGVFPDLPVPTVDFASQDVAYTSYQGSGCSGITAGPDVQAHTRKDGGVHLEVTATDGSARCGSSECDENYGVVIVASVPRTPEGTSSCLLVTETCED